MYTRVRIVRYRAEEAVTDLTSNNGKILTQGCTFELQGSIHIFLHDIVYSHVRGVVGYSNVDRRLAIKDFSFTEL